MDLSHISQDKILPEVNLVSHEMIKAKYFSSIHLMLLYVLLLPKICFPQNNCVRFSMPFALFDVSVTLTWVEFGCTITSIGRCFSHHESTIGVFIQRLVSSVEVGTTTSGVRCCYGLVSLLAFRESRPS